MFKAADGRSVLDSVHQEGVGAVDLHSGETLAVDRDFTFPEGPKGDLDQVFDETIGRLRSVYTDNSAA